MKTSLRLLVLAAIASTFATPHIVIAQEEEPAQEPIRERIPDYGNMVLLGTVPVDDKVDALAFTPDSKTLIASDKDTFRAYDANTGKSVKNISAPKGVRSNFVLFTKDGKTMITANSDGAIRFYDWEKGEVSQTLEGHKTPMLGLVLSPSGKLLASSGMDRIVKVWDVETGELVQEITGVTYAPTVLIFSDDEKNLTTFGGINAVYGFDRTRNLRTENFLWNLEDGSQKQADVIEGFGPPFALTEDATTLVGWSEIKTKTSSTNFSTKRGLRTYKVEKGEQGANVLEAGFGLNNPLIVFSPNKAALAISLDTSGSVDAGNSPLSLWGGRDYDPRTLYRVPAGGSPKVMMFSPDSKILATWYDNLKVNIYRAP